MLRPVKRYWGVTPNQLYAMQQSRCNGLSKFKKNRDVIVKWLKENPGMSADQVLDWLKEYFWNFSVRERTLRRYINELRKRYKLPKPVETR